MEVHDLSCVSRLHQKHFHVDSHVDARPDIPMLECRPHQARRHARWPEWTRPKPRTAAYVDVDIE
eukprot:12438455-Alexandrium_andersonii.AAC.1